VLSADVGEGHAAAARALAAELAAEPFSVEVVVEDGLAACGWLLRRLIRDGYRTQLRRLPWSYGLLYALFTRFPPARALGRSGLRFLASRSLLRLIRSHEPDVVVSTYPGVTAVLGGLRRRGLLRVPTCATITDLAGLAFWADAGIDLHLVMYEECVQPVERLAGEGSVRRVRPLVAPPFLVPRSRSEARQALGLPPEDVVVLVSGGGWGIGDLEGAVRSSMSLPNTRVICVCGRNQSARRRLATCFGADERVSVLGFTERMSELLAAADVLVHSTGGVTCLEALVRGCPIVAYRPSPGHGRLNAKRMASLGLVQAANSPFELVAALRRMRLERPSRRPAPLTSPTAASIVVGARARVRPFPRLWPALARTGAAVAAAVMLGGWTLSSDDPYALVAKTLDLRPLTAVSTSRREVGLVVRVQPTLLPAIATELATSHARASFALRVAPDPSSLAILGRAGDEALPEVASGALTDWLDTREGLAREAGALGLSQRFYYLAPSSGFTLGQYLLARTLGALPVSGSLRLAPGAGAPRALHRGDVVVETLKSISPSALGPLDDLLASLRRRGLRAVPLSELVLHGR
jgi:UDP-N-acetylglucosamine:LPS N-acetylglucosamine transferase